VLGTYNTLRRRLKIKIPATRTNNAVTNLNVSGELIIAVDVDGGEFPDFVELELDLDRLATAVVPPAYPALSAIVIVVSHFEIIGPRSAVRQLTQAPAQLTVPVSVVGRVEEFPSVAPFIALGHRVGHHAVCGRRKSRRVIIEPWLGGGGASSLRFGKSLYDGDGEFHRDACSLMSALAIQRGGPSRPSRG